MTSYYFNSIKVQLKQLQTPGTLRATTFQFHKGTIKTGVFAPRGSVHDISIP